MIIFARRSLAVPAWRSSLLRRRLGPRRRATHDFASPQYWRKFYDRRKDDAAPFEWFDADRALLGRQLARHLLGRPRVLHIGCGTSTLTEEIVAHAAACGDDAVTHHVDISELAVEKVQERIRGMKKSTGGSSSEEVDGAHDARVMDLTTVWPYASGSWSAVVDKGTLDAFADQPATLRAVWGELGRVLAHDGVYLGISAEDVDLRLELFADLQRPVDGVRVPQYTVGWHDVTAAAEHDSSTAEEMRTVLWVLRKKAAHDDE